MCNIYLYTDIESGQYQNYYEDWEEVKHKHLVHDSISQYSYPLRLKSQRALKVSAPNELSAQT